MGFWEQKANFAANSGSSRLYVLPGQHKHWSQSHSQEVNWIPLPNHCIKGNFDASLKDKSGTGFGWFYRDNLGNVLAAATDFCPPHFSPILFLNRQPFSINARSFFLLCIRDILFLLRNRTNTFYED